MIEDPDKTAYENSPKNKYNPIIRDIFLTLLIGSIIFVVTIYSGLSERIYTLLLGTIHINIGPIFIGGILIICGLLFIFYQWIKNIKKQLIEEMITSHDSEVKYRTLIDRLGDVFYLSSDGRYEFINNKIAELLGLSDEEFNVDDFNFLDYITPRSKSMLKDRYQKIKDGVPVQEVFELTAHTKSGAKLILEATESQMTIHGQLVTQGILRDISNKKKSYNIQTALYLISEATNVDETLEELLSDIHQILHIIMDATNFFVALYDRNKKLYDFPIYIDESEEYDGIPQPLEGSLTDYIRKTELPLIIDETLHKKLNESENLRLIGEPSKIWMGAPLRTSQGVIGVVALQSYTDPNLYNEDDLKVLALISGQIAMAIEQKRAEEATERNNRFLKSILDSLSNPLYVINAHDYTIEIANEAAVQRAPGDKIYEHCYELLNDTNSPCKGQEYPCPVRKIIETKKPVKFEREIKDTKGGKQIYEVHSYPIFDANGDVKQIIEYYVDITERKNVENKLISLAVFPEANPNIVLSMNAQQEILYMNSATSLILENFGVTYNEISDCLPPDLDFIIKELFETGEGKQDIRVTINGHTLSWAFHPVIGQDIIHCYASDITDQTKQAEILNMLSTAISQSSNLIVITDTKGIITYVNPYFSKVTGYSAQDTIGKKVSILKSGMMKDRIYRDLWETIRCGKTWTGKLENRKKTGEIYWEQKTISPIYNENGDISHFVSVANDITHELYTQQKLMETEKLSAIGTLAAGVAHEFKNYLGGIIGNASFTLDEIDKPDGLDIARDTLNRIITMGEKANDVAMSLLTFSKAKSEDRKAEDLRKVITQSIKLVEKEFNSSSIEIITHFEDAPQLEISLSKIQQLLLNLFINAKHAIKSNGIVTISLRNKIDYVEIKVTDTGSGIDQEYIDKIFDPFFSTKGVWGRDEVTGTGMGLSICKNIALEHNGDLTVESVKGIGTTFVLRLPVTKTNVQLSSKNLKVKQEITMLLYTIDHSIVSYYYDKICSNNLKLLLMDNFSKIDVKLVKHVQCIVCDAKFPAKLELYRLIEFCKSNRLPYVMVNCGTMEYQLNDIYENAIANYKELPDFEKILQNFRGNITKSTII